MMASDPDQIKDRTERRLDRQFDDIARRFPLMRRPLNAIRARGWWIVRLPIALLFIAGGILSILPFLGLWMLPVGLLLLAVDLPMLRGPMSNTMIRTRRRYDLWRRRRARRKQSK
ncbi:hypothetical protein [uncultured Litoreibacter sp.]|uniref:hypothetical protein n=2 Tax=uncultured Litoreibacter sp. TaxID=1392394 RepID=UPI00262C7555|nr:hypothetical protein [uncultured Litoreibacter sp.]